MELFEPSDPRPLHLMGIAGAGMSALAQLARHRGVPVTGCDREVDGAATVTRDLAAIGCSLTAGHDARHVEGCRAVVFSSAIPALHSELERARELGVPLIRRAEGLALAVGPGLLVAVAGTHGKTTTTAMTVEALAAAGSDPTGIAGGRVSNWRGNARLGGSALFVAEADEYDRSFLALRPQVAVVNNVEPDHLECYGSVEALEEAFFEFARGARRLIVGADDPGAGRVAERARAAGCRVWSFGLDSGATFRVSAIAQSPAGTAATVTTPGGETLSLALRIPGIHNLRNAAAALAVAAELGAPLGPVLDALAQFEGVERRFEVVGIAAGVTVVDDYAHLPAEVGAAIEAARQAYPSARLVAVFQPHLYSRTLIHSEALGRALAAADEVFVTDVYAAREAPQPGVSGELVAIAATAAPSATSAGVGAHWVPERRDLARRVGEAVRAGDVVLTLGAGDITAVGRELLDQLADPVASPA